MAQYSQMIFLVLSLLSITTIRCATVIDNPVDLEAAEANGKLEIIKQIKKVNDDGSYTIGYEADDGTFKIESRDVLGNIKGTYGYIDDEGEVKRVSYSTSNSSELLGSTNEPSSVVQRIPSKLNRTSSSIISPTTGRPIIVYPSTTPSILTTPSVVQVVPRKRIILSSTRSPSSTTTSNYSHFVKDALAATKSSTTAKPLSAIYETSTPARILAQSKPLVRSTSSTQNPSQKSEGQLSRPEVTLKPTDMPLYRRLPIKTTLLDEVSKPVTEETETVRGNLLRRQLPQDKSAFDPRQHVVNVQQTSGDDDMVDVYSSSVTTGAPRTLFTTLRSRISPSTSSPLIHRPTPTIRFTPSYQRPSTTRAPATEYTQESSTEPSITVSPVPVVQIPANRDHEAQRQQFVELRHPFHRGAVLVPVNHLQGRRAPSQQEPNQDYQQIVIPQQQPQHQHDPNRFPIENQQQEDVPFFVRRVPKFRPLPVHVDEHGFVREYPQQQQYLHQQQQYEHQQPIHHQQQQQQQQLHHHQQQQQQQLQQEIPQHGTPTPFSIPLRPQYLSQNDIINEVDQIKPPVTTRDFQRLLQQLISRQSRLEKVSLMMDPRRNPNYFQNRPQQSQYQDFPIYQRQLENPNTGPVQFLPSLQTRNKNYEPTQTAQPQQQHPVIVRPNEENPYKHDIYAPVTFTPTSTYHPTKRMARLLPPGQEDDYLPAPVREMLLLRMLQLAINPSLPLDIPDNVESATTPLPRKEAIRNVEILGEDNEHKRPSRTKRYKEVELDYYD